MLSRIILNFGENMNYRQSSLLQGALMEKISPDYAEFLHQMRRHPYSQYVWDSKWIINTLDEETFGEISHCFKVGDEITLKHNGQKLNIVDIQIEHLPKRKLAEDFYTVESKNKFEVRFLTPAAFRQRKQYVILPDIRLMAQSLMAKYESSFGDPDEADIDALNELVANTFITKHNLHSAIFPAEGQNIPGFVGSMVFICKGTNTMARYWRMLLKFGEFSGIGIKTAMGMGGIKILNY